jgi:arabinofuranosyltransferase
MPLQETIPRSVVVSNNRRLVLVFLCAVFFSEIIRTSWISDDSAITLRTVLNFINGFGPRFNIEERVQAFTHPLWFLSLSVLSAFTREVFFTSTLLSTACSLAAFYSLINKTGDKFKMVVLAMPLVFSKAFVDFSTSGLENPLSHFLLFFVVWAASVALERRTKKSLTNYFLVCSLLYLNRPDLITLVFPLTIYVTKDFWNRPNDLFRAATIGALPVVLWTGFSVFYYGFPFPNTAYAKLGTGIELRERAVQGLAYLADSFRRDPITLVFISFSVVFGVWQKKKCFAALSMGIVLNLIYLVSIGGDFMSGRLLTPALFLSVVLFERSKLKETFLVCLGLILFCIGALNARSTVLVKLNYSDEKIGADGISDERGFYFRRYGLLVNRAYYRAPFWKPVKKTVELSCGGLGFRSIELGPGAHLIDFCGLADPLLSRLPAGFSEKWRIGHFYRKIPTGYPETIESGDNLLVDRDTKNFYDSIRLITRGHLTDTKRLEEIYRFSAGQIKKPSFFLYRFSDIPSLEQVKSGDKQDRRSDS